ncbi:MAG: hypothetical protein K8H88_33235 [Sandaracinaceae bacterium]|nr:hypothetical protein [Sandaracinaceae bacterium]
MELSRRVLEGPLLYFLWAGRTWARMLAIALSVLSLVGFGVLALPPSLASQIAWPLRIKVLVDAMLGVVTPVGLNTRSVRGFFVESSVKARSEPALSSQRSCKSCSSWGAGAGAAAVARLAVCVDRAPLTEGTGAAVWTTAVHIGLHLPAEHVYAGPH